MAAITMASMQIRELDLDRDGDAVIRLALEASPLLLLNLAQWRHAHSAVPERAKRRDWVAELDGAVVGRVVASRGYFADGNDGFVQVEVGSDSRRQGIGDALYRRGLEYLATLGVDRVLSMFDENDDGVAFAEARGFTLSRAESWSVVDPRTVTEVPDGDVVLVPADELDPHELHRLDEEATHDMPSTTDVTTIPYEDWLRFVWENPFFSKRGSFGAIADGRLGALTFLLADTATGRGTTMFTATARSARGRGLGLAVKLASVRWAAENGITQLSTTNDETNAPMLAINRRLGYRPARRRVEYVRAGTPSSPAPPAPVR
jgi:GNAT superfamily N-acetyltransferase